MVDARIVRDAAAQDFGVPCVEVRVKVDDADFAPAIVGRAQGRERGSVITT